MKDYAKKQLPDESLNKALSYWEVSIQPNEAFAASILQDVHSYQSIGGFIRYHRIGFAAATFCLCLMAGGLGYLAAQIQQEASRQNVMAAYVAGLDPRAHASVMEHFSNE